MIKEAYEAGEVKALEDLKKMLEQIQQRVKTMIKHEKKEGGHSKTTAMGVRG